MTRLVPLILAASAVAAPARADELSKDALAANRAACEQARPDCDPVALLSRLERRAADRAIAERGLAYDRSPYGKRIRRIVVDANRVFGPGDGFLRWFNALHVTTRDSAILAELVVVEGEAWDQDRVSESARRLRDPSSTGLVAIVPVIAVGAGEGEVDLLVVTRDVWSLRANSGYEIQQKTVTYLTLSLSENNLLGRRKLLALMFRMDLGVYTIGPQYIDRNMFGRHIYLGGRGGPLFNRQTGELEGSESVLSLARPLWSLDTEWGYGLEWSHRFGFERSFEDTGLRLYDNPDTPEEEAVPYEYGMKRANLAASVTRAFGDEVMQRVRGGYQLSFQRPELPAAFPDDPVLRDAYVDDVLPRSERVSAVFTGWELFEPRYRNYQNVTSFELAEDTRMGVELEASASLALRVLGSTYDFLRLSGVAGYTGALGDDGLWRARVAVTTRLEDGEPIDNIVEGRLRLVTPSFGIGRVVSEAVVSGLFRDSQNQFYTLGAQNGLRGYRIGEFFGDRRVLWQTEYRTRAIPVLFTRWGLAAFYDAGSAADRFDELRLHHDVGVGFRILVPQIDPDVFRVDFAFPLERERLGELRFSAAYNQSF